MSRLSVDLSQRVRAAAVRAAIGFRLGAAMLLLLLPATASTLFGQMVSANPDFDPTTPVGGDPFGFATSEPFPMSGASPAANYAMPAAAMVPADPLAPGLGPTIELTPPSSPEIGPTTEAHPFWHARRSGFAWLSKSGDDGFGIADFELATSFAPIYFDDLPALLMTPGFGMHLWDAPAGLDMPSQVYDFYLDITWRTPINDKWGASFGVTPGLYGDLDDVNSDTFQLTGWGTADYALGSRWTLIGGVAVVRQLEARVLPVGGVIWTPNETTRAELLVPRVRLAKRLRSSPRGDLWTYLSGQFGGGSWSITLDDGSTTLLTYNDLRIVLGAEWVGVGRMSGVAEAGYVFSRDISAFDTSQSTPSDAFMLRLGCGF